MLVDSHCHPNFPSYRAATDAVVRRCLDNDIWLIAVGTNAATSQEVVTLAEQYPAGVFATVGVHPTHLVEPVTEPDGTVVPIESLDVEYYRTLATSSPKVVGIGEVGLDYYRTSVPKAQARPVQLAALRQLLTLGQELNLPLVLHCRNSEQQPGDAYDDLIALIKEFQTNGGVVRGVAHCYGGDLSQAKQLVDLGLYIGVTGVITFRSAHAFREMISQLPLERLLVETDAPFLTPEPHRGKQNEPAYVQLVAEKLASVLGRPITDIMSQTTANARELFRLM